MTDNLIGKTIGGYEILNVIGQGGMASVFRAQQISMDRVVAVKVLPRQFLNDDTYIQRFNQEVKIVSQLEHRNIVPVYDYGQYDGQPYIVMRYMPAGSVDDLLPAGPLELATILKIVEQIASALDYAHTKKVLHRDLKPSNVLMDNDGGAFITDFGIARILGQQGPGITTQGVVGTPAYMSPEQAQAHPLDRRSDIYSLGVMVFEMATGRRPFEADTPYGIAVLQVTAAPPTPRTINASIPTRVEHVILRALKKNPDERYGAAAELAEALREAVETPEKLHDTQPRPIFVAPPAPAVSQPAMPPPVYAPSYTPMPPPSGHAMSVSQSQVSAGFRARVRRRRQSSVWFSVAFGGVIGCALLTVITVLAAILVRALANSTPLVVSPTGQVDGPVVGQDETATMSLLELTSEAARKTLVPESAATDGATSVGVQPTATFSPLISQARGTLVYHARDEDSWEIFTLNLANRVRTQLTSDPSATSNLYPAASRDGQYIVFQSDRDGDNDIYIVNKVGGELRKMTHNDVKEWLPAWSPDGQWIIYSSDVRGDETYDLYMMRVDGSETRELFSNGKRNSHARFSPDGRYVVFSSGEPKNARTWEILLLDTTTGEVKQLTENQVRDGTPSFSPDGDHILYTTGGEGDYAIAQMNPDGSGKEVIYDSPGGEWAASYSPDGKYIAFVNWITSPDSESRNELFIMTADGVEAQLITDTEGFFPSWIP